MPDVPTGPPLATGEATALTLLADGLSNADIAARLGVARSAVTSTLRRVQNKVGGTTQPTLVDRAYRRGHLQTPDRRAPLPGKELDAEGARILTLLAAGTTAPQIATALELSHATASRRIRDVHEALGANSTAHAVRLGWECGYLQHTEDPPQFRFEPANAPTRIIQNLHV